MAKLAQEDTGAEILTIIGLNVKAQGQLNSSDDIEINGQVEGEVRSDKNVLVGETAEVHAQISAHSILVAGQVNGNLQAKEECRLTSTARVLGKIVTDRLVVESGAQFNGEITMDRPGGIPEVAPPKN